MATHLNIELPGGWTQISGGPRFLNLFLERFDGGVEIQQNWPRAIWAFNVSYMREDYEGNFDQIYSFFLNTAGAVSFDVEDAFDCTDSSKSGQGKVEQVDGVWRLTKHYPFGSGFYQRVIYRPKAGIVLTGGASGGTVDYDDGTVSGVSSPGGWTGSFRIPMVFLQNQLQYTMGADGIVRAMNVPLQEDPFI